MNVIWALKSDYSHSAIKSNSNNNDDNKNNMHWALYEWMNTFLGGEFCRYEKSSRAHKLDGAVDHYTRFEVNGSWHNPPN